MFTSDEQSPMHKHATKIQVCASAFCQSICLVTLPLAPLLIHLYFHAFVCVLFVSLQWNPVKCLYYWGVKIHVNVRHMWSQLKDYLTMKFFRQQNDVLCIYQHLSSKSRNLRLIQTVRYLAFKLNDENVL